MATLLSQIKLRRGTAAELDAMSPVLAVGEPAFSTDTHRFAIGDGKHNFSQLALRIKDGVTNVSGEANCINQIAVFSNNAGDDIEGRNVTINDQAIMAGVKQINIENDADKAPLVIANKVLVSNLNAQYLNGQDHTYYFNHKNHLGYPTNAESGLFAVLQDSTSKKLYVDIGSVANNATITLKGTDMSITNPSFTLNQADNQEITLTVAKEPSGGRTKGSIVSARETGIIQSNEYEISYTASGSSTINVGATMVYDQALKAVKFVF